MEMIDPTQVIDVTIYVYLPFLPMPLISKLYEMCKSRIIRNAGYGDDLIQQQ